MEQEPQPTNWLQSELAGQSQSLCVISDCLKRAVSVSCPHKQDEVQVWDVFSVCDKEAQTNVC